jgi:transposase
MIRLPPSIYIATAPVDLHWSFDRLAGVVREQLGGDPRSETLFVFHNRRRTHAKLLWHDGTGYCVLYKRLDRGTLRIPLPVPPGAARVSMTERELRLLLEGIDEAVLRQARRTARAMPRARKAPVGVTLRDHV